MSVEAKEQFAAQHHLRVARSFWFCVIAVVLLTCNLHQGVPAPQGSNAEVSNVPVWSGNQRPTTRPHEEIKIFDHNKKIGTVFMAGFVKPLTAASLGATLFAEYTINLGNFTQHTPHTPNDIFFVLGQCTSRTQDCKVWMQNFKGKILVVNGESRGGWGSRESGYFHRDRFYQIGYFPDTTYSLRMRFVQFTLMEYGPEKWQKVFEPSQKPVSTRERFMVYAVSNCLSYREEAARIFARDVGQVEYAGRCKGSTHGTETVASNKNKTVKGMVGAPGEFRKADWMDNSEWFGRYRFCLVLENAKVDGYISEKILNAFLGGCVPIYYGTAEVFDIFNQAAFVYYDIKDPRPAVARVVELENNKTAYDQVMAQPILAAGDQSINKYFSFGDTIGDGSLKRRIHSMMKLPTVAFV